MMSLNTWTTTTTVITSILALLATGCGGDISPDGSTLDGEEVSEVSKQEAATQRRTAALEEAPSSVCSLNNAPIEVIIPAVVPKIFSLVKPGDAPIILRTTTLLTNVWFDAIAPYNPTAVGVYSDLGRRPPEEWTDCNRNIAIFYSSYQMLNSLMPQFNADWRAMMESNGLDPDDDSTDLTSPIGLGNVAGAAVVAVREQDGMNQLGDAGPYYNAGLNYNLRPYADYTDYQPVNTAYELYNPRRWQPDFLTTGSGIFSIQQFVTPQLGFTTPYSYDQPYLWARPPWKSYAVLPWGRALRPYRNQADQVLEVSAVLTDEQKMISELFDDKITSLGFSILFLTLSRGLTVEQFVQLDYAVNVAAFDTMITVWANKRHYDAVRPFSAIRYLYGDEELVAWGGPGQGTVDDILGSEWRPYLQSANHPEYPSASASFCRAHATAATLYMGGDNSLGWEVPYPAGSSVVEPGITPAQDIVLSWDTWDDFSYDCGISRLWAGVHFYDSIPAGQALGDPIGRRAYEFVDAHIRGDREAIEEF